ncbi:ras-related protein Rab-17 isoform X1 [Bombina bombina]|uniref:ras-related protein Rab-17 isoform X1 n=1 Tax=Bombina bombina TaxID=8345 RepID=UPI00235AB45E|nr:ras-related protein Rab-17 isoform X1 [Bombina bombina]
MEQCIEHSVLPSEDGKVPVHKLMLLGSSNVGKSSITLRFVRDEFRDCVPTTGCDFFSKRICLYGKNLDFEIWDTAGQEIYHSVCHLYYRGTSAAMLVYDTTHQESFFRAQLWLQELQKYFSPEELVIALIGNKSDLQEERKVSQEDGKTFADKNKLLFVETSAQTGVGVQESFEAIARELMILELQKRERKHRLDRTVTMFGAHRPRQKMKCCTS